MRPRFCRCLPRAKEDTMCAEFGDTAGDYEPLLSDDSSKELSSSDSHGWPLLNAVICANFILLVISVSVLAFGGYIHGSHSDKSLLSSAYDLNGYFSKGFQLVMGYGMETQNPDWACVCEVVHSQFTSLHLKFTEMAYIHVNIHGITKYPAELVKFYRLFTNFFKQFWVFDGSVALKNGKMPRTSPPTFIPHTSPAILKKEKGRSHTSQKAKIASFLKIMKDLSHEGLLQFHQRVLCLDPIAGRKVRALKKRKGFSNIEHIDISLTPSASNQKGGRNLLLEAFTDQTFDFVFTTVFDCIEDPALFVAEIERILKIGGVAAMHVSLNAWHNKYIKAIPGESAKPVTVLFTMSKIVYVSAAYAPGLDTLIVFKKVTHVEDLGHTEKTKAADQADQTQVNREHVTSLSEKGADFSGSATRHECRKCFKQQNLMLAPRTLE